MKQTWFIIVVLSSRDWNFSTENRTGTEAVNTFLSIIVSMKEAPRLSDYSRTITFPTRWGSGSTSRGPGKGARSHRICAGVELPLDSCGVTAGDIPTGQVTTGGYIGDGTNETGNCWGSEKQVQVLLRRLQMKCNLVISSYGKKL